MNPLTQSELDVALSDLEGWTVSDNKLTKVFEFKDFRDAITFLVRLAFDVEEMNHHPEVENVYNRIRFSLCSHDAGSQVTEKDIKLAKQIESLHRA